MVLHRYRCIFSGDVQGVGFRFTARCIAERFGITGWVKNLYDGRVEMEAQGTTPALGEMMSSLQNSRYIHIDHVDTREIPVLPDDYRFSIH